MKKILTKKLLGGTILATLCFQNAYAVPSFTRQTGLDCKACHTVFPELTQTGREFKLHGYTMSNGKKAIPLSAMVMAGITKSSDEGDMSKDGKIVIPEVSLFYAGKITDKSGAFIQLTYDGTELLDNTDIAHHIGMDNMDIRYADSTKLAGKELIYGITVNNNPSVADLWNSTPAWSFPYTSSETANSPSAAVLADGGLGQAVGGIGAYALWNDLVYAEIAAYRSAKGGIMSIFGWKNQDLKGDASLVEGTTPYGRLALQHNFGDHYVMLGGYAMRSEINPLAFTNAGGPIDIYSDHAIDAEYQYTNGSSIVTATATKIWETQTLDGSVLQGMASNSKNKLSTNRAKVSYYYDQKYGASLGYFSTSGTSDPTLYADNATFSPNSSGEVAEIDYLPANNIKLSLQYTRYSKFDGASSNYDGSGRDASDNNNIYLLGWFMF